VSGHVDGVGSVLERATEARSERMLINCPANLLKYIAAKGSVCVDGVSLTVNHKSGSGFTVNIIPHTLKHTISGEYVKGTRVNIEVDLIARYLAALNGIS
jgi:riboflavin synthase